MLTIEHYHEGVVAEVEVADFDERWYERRDRHGNVLLRHEMSEAEAAAERPDVPHYCEPSGMAPDVDAFLDALDQALPRDVLRRLAGSYGDVLFAVQRGRYQRAWQGLADAVNADGLTDDEHDEVLRLAEQHRIPLPDEES